MLRRPNPIQPLPVKTQSEESQKDIWEQILDTLRQIAYNASIPLSAVDSYVFVDEFIDAPNSLSITATDTMVMFPILATSIIAAIPAGATGTLQIGQRVIPLSGGLQTGLQQIQMIIYPQDQIILTSSASGNLYLEIMGGRIMNDLWRRV